MNENETFDLLTTAEADTVRLGQKLAHFAQKGDTFALFGTLGMGKSVLARAFIRELTGAKEVPSPTFTLLQSYEAPDFEIYHFDLYRLKSPEEIFEIGMEDALYGGVCLIEWPEQMGRLPSPGCFSGRVSAGRAGTADNNPCRIAAKAAAAATAESRI